MKNIYYLGSVGRVFGLVLVASLIGGCSKPEEETFIVDEAFTLIPPGQQGQTLESQPASTNVTPSLTPSITPPEKPKADPSIYGTRIGLPGDMAVTMDFIDQDGDQVDDRYQKGPGQPKQK